MEIQLECIINNSSVTATVNPGIVLLDFLRKHEHLTGTKEGCREGDCGACTVLVGDLCGGEVVYTSVNSCLLPLADVQGKHIVTIEGINQPSDLTPIQQAFVKEGGTQCGFCTPGFILSLTGYCLKDAREHSVHEGVETSANAEHGAITVVAETETVKDAIAITAVDGNICRCTGHSPIKKAIRRINEHISSHAHMGGSPLARIVAQKILPDYFLTIGSRLTEIQSRTDTDVPSGELRDEAAPILLAGGTDLYVQKAFTMHTESVRRIPARHQQVEISESDDAIHIPGSTTIETFRCSPIVRKYFPALPSELLQFGSTPIRARATIAGNLANASPIADMACLFMALNAEITLQKLDATRTMAFRKLYTGYKQLDMNKTELIVSITIAKPGVAACLSYEKVSRRKYLDIASVNSAMAFDAHNGTLSNVGISAGGVGPTMLFLAKTSAFLTNTTMDSHVFTEAWNIASGEISPISDARGSAGYKRMLLRQLLAAHVMKYFPGVVKKEALL